MVVVLQGFKVPGLIYFLIFMVPGADWNSDLVRILGERSFTFLIYVLLSWHHGVDWKFRSCEGSGIKVTEVYFLASWSGLELKPVKGFWFKVTEFFC